MLLKLLSEKDMYGYETLTTLRKRSQNVFELKAGTLYPLLHAMEEEEWEEYSTAVTAVLKWEG